MVSREIWEKHALMSFSKTQIELVLRTRAILYIFEKLTRACFSQIALETILLPILTTRALHITHNDKKDGRCTFYQNALRSEVV